jgi:hypothetical protein
VNQRLHVLDPVLSDLRLHLGLRMRAYVELEHDHVIRRYAEFGAKDVGAEVAVGVVSVCTNPLDPSCVARFAPQDGRDG